MNSSKLKTCKDCPYTKCGYKVEHNFSICPVEARKQVLIKNDN